MRIEVDTDIRDIEQGSVILYPAVGDPEVITGINVEALMETILNAVNHLQEGAQVSVVAAEFKSEAEVIETVVPDVTEGVDVKEVAPENVDAEVEAVKTGTAETTEATESVVPEVTNTADITA